LSKVLLSFAIEFENESVVSLAISANILRLAVEQTLRVRDVPQLAGASNEAVAMSLSFLEKQGYARVQPESPGSRIKLLVLTPKGQAAQKIYQPLSSAIEHRWRTRFGEKAVQHLRASLEQLVGEPTAKQPPLLRGLEPYPSGWRASIDRIERLPHYPMILHRGGFPDGS
jgi:DNA-binding MarR family transcriptional regulator